MSRKRKAVKPLDLSKDLWINPRLNMRGADGNRAWDNSGNIDPTSGARFLELADVALGLKKPTPKTKKSAAAGAHESSAKTEPYSN
jgi:hypothetical protein